MNFGKPIYVAPGIHQLRVIGSRVTVIASDDAVAIVDTGSPGSFGAIASGFKALGLSLDRVRWIILTHFHPDHSGSLGKLALETGAQVAMHALEWPILSGQTVASPFSNHVVARLTDPVVQQLYDVPPRVDRLLQDGDEIVLGNPDKLTVIHTPGHTPGNISLLATPQRTLIVGDALQRKSGVLKPPAPSVTKDKAQALQSVRKLLDLDVEALCFGHFPPITSSAHEALRRQFSPNAPLSHS